jgi:hypothetical protein
VNADENWPIVPWYGTRETFDVAGPTPDLDEWLLLKGWRVDMAANLAGPDSDPAVHLINDETTQPPIRLQVTEGDTLQWDGWHLKVAHRPMGDNLRVHVQDLGRWWPIGAAADAGEEPTWIAQKGN